jgi:hypothetical protein
MEGPKGRCPLAAVEGAGRAHTWLRALEGRLPSSAA